MPPKKKRERSSLPASLSEDEAPKRTRRGSAYGGSRDQTATKAKSKAPSTATTASKPTSSRTAKRSRQQDEEGQHDDDDDKAVAPMDTGVDEDVDTR